MKMWHKMVGRKWNTNFWHDHTERFPDASFQKKSNRKQYGATDEILAIYDEGLFKK